MSQFDNYDDAYEEEYENKRFRWMSGLVLVLAIAGFFALAWYAYYTGTQSVEETNKDMTVIEADNSPIKEAPEDPGGQEFPNQDKTVYDAISSDKPKDDTAESILPPAEEPVVKEEVKTETPKESAPEMKAEAPAIPPAPVAPVPAKPIEIDKKELEKVHKAMEEAKEVLKAAPAPVAPVPPPAMPKPIEVSEPKLVTVGEPPAIKKPVEAKPAAPKAIEAKPAATGSGKIQLGAYPSAEEAEKDWKRISAKQSAVLGGKAHNVVEADLGDKGIFYRLRASGFPDAKAACAALSAKGQACMVVSK